MPLLHPFFAITCNSFNDSFNIAIIVNRFLFIYSLLALYYAKIDDVVTNKYDLKYIVYSILLGVI